MRILLLAGGSSNERDVSIRSGAAVEKALKSRGHDVLVIDPKDNIDWVEVTKNIDVVFIALHGSGGEDGTIQAQLEKTGVPYTGSNVEASELCWDKWAYKEFLIGHDLPASKGVLVSSNDTNHEYFLKPFVLKPIKGGSTLDTLIVRNPSPEKDEEVKKLLEKYDQMLLEPLIEGQEITIPVVGDQALDVIEIIPPESKEFDYENKYNGATQELCPPKNVPETIQKMARELALQIHQLTGCRDLSRTDIMIDKNGNLHILETNIVPGLTDTSLLPKSAAVSNMSMPDLCEKLIQLALKH